MEDGEQFQADLEALGFRLVQDRGTGIAQFAATVTPYLTYWVHWDLVKEEVLFTWEHAIGQYFSDNGLQVGANDEMNEYLFPKFDSRGPQEIAFVVQEMDRTEQVLRGLNLLDGAG